MKILGKIISSSTTVPGWLKRCPATYIYIYFLWSLVSLFNILLDDRWRNAFELERFLIYNFRSVSKSFLFETTKNWKSICIFMRRVCRHISLSFLYTSRRSFLKLTNWRFCRSWRLYNWLHTDDGSCILESHLFFFGFFPTTTDGLGVANTACDKANPWSFGFRSPDV